MADKNTRQHVDKRTARIENRGDFMAHIEEYKAEQAKSATLGRELTRIFHNFNPEKVRAVNDLVVKHRGKEDELLANVRAKYGVCEGECSHMHQELTAVMEKHRGKEDKSIMVCARKRPLFDAELGKKEYE